MPSLRKRVSTYLRQLSFHQESRDKQRPAIESTFVVRYLEGEIKLTPGPKIHTGKLPTDLPSMELAAYETGPDSTLACYTGPDGGLTAVSRRQKHLTLADADIAFIDTPDDDAAAAAPPDGAQCEQTPPAGRVVDNTTMLIKMAGQEYLVTNSRQSLDGRRVDRTKRLPSDDSVQMAPPCASDRNAPAPPAARGARRQGRITRLPERPASESTPAPSSGVDTKLPAEWSRRSEFAYGVSDSLYDRNLSTRMRNGTPIADCFGVIARADSAILAVADGVNWGEKAAIAAKSAVHASLHYLNRTLFLDTRPFDRLAAADGGAQMARTATTRDVHVALLRAFRCAHDLILENGGMLTTLTVAVAVPLRAPSADGGTHVVCACNVGDSLAYVYSPVDGVRELTRASHDVGGARDMRDALGALGPVDGAMPELANLTLSMSTLRAGDVLLMASDGLTDNLDPTVCRLAASATPPKPPRRRAPPGAAAASGSMVRAHTALELRAPPRVAVARSVDGLPLVTGAQRYELTLLLIEDVARRCGAPTARQLCDKLLAFAVAVTSAKRRALEDSELYFSRQRGVLVELPPAERKARRKRALERVQAMPGKLDHVTVVACNVGNRALTHA